LPKGREIEYKRTDREKLWGNKWRMKKRGKGDFTGKKSLKKAGSNSIRRTFSKKEGKLNRYESLQEKIVGKKRGKQDCVSRVTHERGRSVCLKGKEIVRGRRNIR